MAKKNNGMRMRRTTGGSPIVDAPIVANVSGGSDIIRKRPRAMVKGNDGTTYMVPVNSDGFVPEDALYEHFLDYTRWSSKEGGERNPNVDAQKVAVKLHSPKDERGFTPEEIVATGWWKAVNGSDVVGIDDGTSSVLKKWDDVKDSYKSSLGKIAIIAPKATQERVVKTLQDNFTVSELRRMTDRAGLIYIEGNPGIGADGCYYRKQEGIETPNIIIRGTSGEDTITHETVHHARATDQKRKGIARTPFPMDESECLIRYPRSMEGTMINLEEAATVAETTARTRDVTDNLGYYTRLDGDPRELYDQDRRTMSRGRPLRGKRAVDRVNDSFEDTNISELRYRKDGKRPRDTIEEGREKGEYPARKTASKPKASAKPTGKAKAPAKKGGSR